MRVQLEVTSEELQISDKRLCFEGDIIDAEFTRFGVSLLFGNVWSLYFSYDVIKAHFKVYGQ